MMVLPFATPFTADELAQIRASYLSGVKTVRLGERGDRTVEFRSLAEMQQIIVDTGLSDTAGLNRTLRFMTDKDL